MLNQWIIHLQRKKQQRFPQWSKQWKIPFQVIQRPQSLDLSLYLNTQEKGKTNPRSTIHDEASVGTIDDPQKRLVGYVSIVSLSSTIPTESAEHPTSRPKFRSTTKQHQRMGDFGKKKLTSRESTNGNDFLQINPSTMTTSISKRKTWIPSWKTVTSNSIWRTNNRSLIRISFEIKLSKCSNGNPINRARRPREPRIKQQLIQRVYRMDTIVLFSNGNPISKKIHRLTWAIAPFPLTNGASNRSRNQVLRPLNICKFSNSSVHLRLSDSALRSLRFVLLVGRRSVHLPKIHQSVRQYW